MHKGMIVQCGSCGKGKYFDFDKSEDEIEKQIDDAVEKEGWRSVKRWNGYICGDCRKKGGDPLYNTFFGKPKTESKLNSYVNLRYDAEMQLAQFKTLEKM